MGKDDIATSVETSRVWTNDQARQVVNELYASVQKKTTEAIDWYFKKKRWPARASQWTRAIAIVFTVLRMPRM